MKKILRDPLLHFLLIGAAFFLVFGLMKAPVGNEENRIVITTGDIESLQANFARTWQRLPSDSELSGLIEDKIRDEIAFREAAAMGLDQDDAVIRRRMRMKMELLMEDIAGLSPPSEEELAAFLLEQRDSFHQEPQVSFKQVYLNSDKRGAGVSEAARKMLAELAKAGPGADPEIYSDPNMLPNNFPLNYISDFEKLFGGSFATDLLQVEPGKWAGPVRSSYGLHLVFVWERIAGRDPELAEVRDEVEREWTAQRRREFKEETYKKLRERYTIVIEEQKPQTDDNKISTRSK
ncbi:MAG: peptidyl-prolyl cis-trans isomerase [Deltaproteobacteria bacterium]|jgi:hypothetical protein|nr:peptidyl-prolyl cis-trans isomerase [Deltaproteobacteria bacterium]